MNFLKTKLPRFSALSLSLAAIAATSPAHADVDIGAAGWIQYGRIGNSSDSASGPDLDGKSVYTSGAQITAKTKLSERVDGVAGIGVFYGHTLASAPDNAGGYAPPFIAPYVSEANFTLNFYKEEESALFLRGGLFPYDYNPEVTNLGLYLLRGPVYPGYVLSGFEEKNVLPVASLLGIQLHQRIGAFEHDFLINSELDFFPYFDLSPAYLAAYHFGKAFRLGGGVNFYHLIPITDSLTSGKWDRLNATYIDTVDGNKLDTNLLGMSGIKLMVNGALDLKELFGGSESMGAEDLKLYGEVALLGLNNDRVHKKLYGGYANRMPMMIGFNFPMFNLLDRLALETEWYSSPLKDDLQKFNHTAGSHQNAIPFDRAGNSGSNFKNYSRDNLKWSIYGSKVIQGHVKISFQIADDHYRPGLYTGDGDNNAPSSQALLTTPKDWYTMVKVAYFF